MTTFSTLPSLPTFLPGTNPATDGDTFLAALPTLVSQGNTIGTEVQTNYDNSHEYNKRVNVSLVRLAAYLASSSSNSTLATSLRNAALWVSGTTYSLNTYVFSPTNFRLYRRKVAGAGTTDPSTDTANWNLVALELGTNLPSIRPTLSLNFTVGEVLDHRITFSRSSSATRYNRKGLIELVGVNQPRFDYDPSTLQAKGFLIEESRTNLLLRSEEFDNASWTKINATISANAATAPDGTMTADKLVETAVSGTHIALQSATGTSTNVHTLSVFAKAGERSKIVLQIDATTVSGGICVFDISNGTNETPAGSGSPTVAITHVGSGWYRCSITAIPGASGSVVRGIVYLVQSGTITTYTGDGTSGLYIWGAQLEAGAFPTSYIPTTSTSVTRSADLATISGVNFTNWFNSLEGTFVVNSQSVNNTSASTRALIEISNATVNNRIILGQSTSTASKLLCSTSGVTQGDLSAVTDGTAFNKSTFAYKQNLLLLCSNAELSLTDSSVTLPSCSQLSIGNDYSQASASCINGWLKQITYYRKALPYLECIECST